MATKLEYLENFDIVKCHGCVVATEKTDDGRVDIQLDKTCFYPRGGGQDWDTGKIQASDESTVFNVEEVRLDEIGVVHHIGNYTYGLFQNDTEVICSVDTGRRNVNTGLHSAGHVVDLAVDRIGKRWMPVRGAHYPHMSFVEYEGEASPEEYETIKTRVESIVHEVIARGSQNEIRFMPVSEMPTVCRHIPENIPTNKPARVVIYDGDYGIPCGGTHVANLQEIGSVTITKVKSKKGITKVSYSVEGIN